jgi:hypothetical protein
MMDVHGWCVVESLFWFGMGVFVLYQLRVKRVVPGGKDRTPASEAPFLFMFYHVIAVGLIIPFSLSAFGYSLELEHVGCTCAVPSKALTSERRACSNR